MIENQMINFKEKRLNYEQYAQVQKMYHPQPQAKKEQGCIVKLANGKEFRRLV